MQICGIWVNALGILLNLFGVLLILFSPRRRLALDSWEPSRSIILGLALLAVGFLLQFVFAASPLLAG